MRFMVAVDKNGAVVYHVVCVNKQKQIVTVNNGDGGEDFKISFKEMSNRKLQIRFDK